ncbi:MAG TPA: MnhB domain-containing protein [Synergistaceae bacterium]|mgnify:CR=1 FL=1|nr:MnhB domain-containing protein [Synergistaceae bacterium]HPJ25800.1 MnhB domain-containing protein [Synergistaceae bacterium]HPQ37692.1 MnhB domain-containing protein [Synergistaceae bacterium]
MTFTSSRLIHRIPALLLSLGIGFFLWRGLVLPSFPHLGSTAAHYVTHTASETGASNVVAAILFDYRAFDSLGEATVIYTTVCGVALLFAGRRYRSSRRGLSFVVKRGMALMVPFILLYASTIVLMGHLTPGGGFQGGVILATITVLFCIVYGSRFEAAQINPNKKEMAESFAGLFFVGLGLVGLLGGAGFLANLRAGFPGGTPGELLSAGTIPFLNIAVGLKVGASLSTLFYSMIKILEAPSEGPPPEVFSS